MLDDEESELLYLVVMVDERVVWLWLLLWRVVWLWWFTRGGILYNIDYMKQAAATLNQVGGGGQGLFRGGEKGAFQRTKDF
jgi:hypothetical protein